MHSGSNWCSEVITFIFAYSRNIALFGGSEACIEMHKKNILIALSVLATKVGFGI